MILKIAISFVVKLLLYFLCKELVKVSTDCATVDRMKPIIIIVVISSSISNMYMDWV